MNMYYLREHILLYDHTSDTGRELKFPSFALMSEQTNLSTEGVLVLINASTLNKINKKQIKSDHQRILQAFIVKKNEIIIARSQSVWKLTFPGLEPILTKSLALCNFMQQVNQESFLLGIDGTTVALVDVSSFSQISALRLKVQVTLQSQSLLRDGNQQIKKIIKTQKKNNEFLILLDNEIVFISLQGNTISQNQMERYCLFQQMHEVRDYEKGNKLLIMSNDKLLVISRKLKQIQNAIQSENLIARLNVPGLPLFIFQFLGKYPYCIFAGVFNIVKINLWTGQSETEFQDFDDQLIKVIRNFNEYHHSVFSIKKSSLVKLVIP